VVTAIVGVVALVGGVGGWVIRQANLIERVLLIGGGLALFYADASLDVLGIALVFVGVGLHWLRQERFAPTSTGVT
jgi:TRAP-type uncharacterized transport system fused permease subunit